MVQSVSTKNTKAEIMAAFRELQKENKALTLELKQQEKVLAQVQSAPSASAPAEPTPTKAKSSTADLKTNIEQTLAKLAAVQVGFGGAVSNLSEQLISEASRLEELQENVAEITEQLAQLHDVDTIEDDTLTEMIAAYEESSKTFAQELETRRETLEQELSDLQDAWQKEQETHHRTVRDRNEAARKERQREEQDYQYALELERNLSDEADQQEQQQREQELAESRQTQEKAWEEREKAIADQEKEHAEAKEKVEAFEADLKKQKQDGKAAGQKIGNYNAKVKADLRTKEIEGERNNYTLRISALESTISHNNHRLQGLSKKLDATLKQVQDLAVKAIEGKANQSALDDIKAIASELAKGQSKSGR